MYSLDMATVRLHGTVTFSSIGVCMADIDMTTFMMGLVDGYGMESWNNCLRLR